MSNSRRVLIAALAICLLPAIGPADPVILPPATPSDGPTDNAVQLPPQTFDDSAKAPNTTRESYGEWTIYGGVFLLQPVFQGNPAFVVNGAGGNVTRQVDFGYHLDAAPNVWIGYVSERGWGVRGRWFQFDQDGSTGATAAPGDTITGMSPLTLGKTPVTGTVAAWSHLAVNVFDVQGTYTYENGRWTHLLGFGVRYTHLTQEYQADLRGGNNIDLTSNHGLSGAGPSFSLETKYRLAETGFSLYGQLYGAILFGHASENYTAINNGVVQQFTGNPTSVLPVGEMEMGGEYQKNVGRAKLFLQAGFNGQIWWGGGNASNVDAAGFSSASHSSFGFLGLALRAGVRY